MWLTAAYKWTHCPSWFAWFEGWLPQMNHVNSCNGYRYNNSNIITITEELLLRTAVLRMLMRPIV